MTQLWRLWLRNRWRGVIAALIGVLTVLLTLLVATGGSGVDIRFLGDAAAPRAHDANNGSGTVLPRSGDSHAQPGSPPDSRSSILDEAAPAGAGPQDVTAAQAAWSNEEVKQHEQEVLRAVNCVRMQHGMPAVTIDPALSRTAGEAWLRLSRDHSFSLMSLPGTYALRSVLALDFGMSDPVAQPGQGEQTNQEGSRCTVGAFDAATLPLTTATRTIGIAVFPPQAAWDLSSAVVLMQ